MIRVNLLGAERQKVRKTRSVSPAKLAPAACALIFAGAGVGIGWWAWSLHQESIALDAQIAAAQQEVTRLQSVLEEVQRFESEREQLRQRVQLIEQLRSGQSLHVRLLDHVSRSLPDMLWLTEMAQEGQAITIEGRSTTLIALSDFVGNLSSGSVLQKPVDIVNSQVETVRGNGPGEPDVELIDFAVRAELAPTAPDVKSASGATSSAGD
jgi:type IV pilus assembly protein PilN